VNRDALFAILFRHRGGVLLLLAAPVVAAALHGSEITRASALVGTCIAGAGVWLRLYAAHHIGRSARTRRPHASTGIIAAGPYRWSRNPLYLAAGLMLCGLGLLAGAGWLAAALLPATLLAYTPVVLAEERALAALGGDSYQRYVASVPRWIGIPRRYEDEKEGALIRWREVFHREKWLVPGYTAAVLAIAVLHTQRVRALEIADRLGLALHLDIAVLTALAACLAIAGNAIKVEIHRRRRRSSSA
jgi:protein-S-isoprenylcysteine O-methyltransferase Ste14